MEIATSFLPVLLFTSTLGVNNAIRIVKQAGKESRPSSAPFAAIRQ